MSNSDIAEILEKFFRKKKAGGNSVSIRTLAPKLGISSTYLHQILRGQRITTPALYRKLCELLDVDIENRDYILKRAFDHLGVGENFPPGLKASAAPLKPKRKDWSLAGSDRFKFLKKWYYIPILESTRLENYDGSAEFVASQLNLSADSVRTAMAQLAEAGLLVEKDGRLVKDQNALNFNSNNSKDEIREFHQANLKLASTLLSRKTADKDLEERLVTSMTFICRSQDVPIVKQRIAAFMEDLSTDYSVDDADCVYHFGSQLFRVENFD